MIPKGTCFILTILASLSLGVLAEVRPIWLLVGDDKLQAAAEPLSAFRRAEGLDVRFAQPPVSEAVKLLEEPPSYLVLLGDDLLADSTEVEGAMLAGERRTLYRWQATQPETFVSDAIFGDLDGDEVPDIPVGRLPGRSPEEIGQLARKIVAFEKSAITWDALRLPVWAGNPAYGDHFQANMASNLLRQTLHLQAPAWADLELIMGNEKDPLSAVPEKQASLFHAWLKKGGGLFTGMMGHGGVEAFYSMPGEGGWVNYHCRQTEGIVGGQASAPAIIFACDCGNFAHPARSLSEGLLQARGGPVAVIAATTQSHPLPNYYSSICWLQELARPGGSDRLGDLWVATQKLGFKRRDVLVEMVLANIEGKLEAKLDTPRIRQDHLLLYALMGDPATTLKRPRSLEATFERDGESWRWTIAKPPTDAVVLQVAHRTVPPPLKLKSDKLKEEEAMALYQEVSASLRFKELDTVSSPESWTGIVAHQRGTLRLVVEAGGNLWWRPK